MPVITSFYGISIKMYFQRSEHNPPHVHAAYGESEAEFEIRTGKVLEGSLPRKAVMMVQEWIGLHRDELLRIWTTQEFVTLPPLE